jgi:hypothetical protein
MARGTISCIPTSRRSPRASSRLDCRPTAAIPGRSARTSDENPHHGGETWSAVARRGAGRDRRAGR